MSLCGNEEDVIFIMYLYGNKKICNEKVSVDKANNASSSQKGLRA